MTKFERECQRQDRINERERKAEMNGLVKEIKATTRLLEASMKIDLDGDEALRLSTELAVLSDRLRKKLNRIV